jgi:hypothetical protein
MEIENQYKIHLLMNEKDQLEKNKELPGYSPDKKAAILSLKDKLNKEIDYLTIQNRKNKDLKRLYSSQIDIVNSIEQYKNVLRDLSQRLDSDIETSVNLVISNGINEMLKSALTKMLDAQNALSDNDRRKSTVEEFERQEKVYRDSIESLRLLDNVLSPKSGIIAESLIGFINDILSFINDFINRVWTYPLEIIPVEIENDDDVLDYKFKIRVNDDEVVDDISEASSGMKEIINLAFKICILSYMNFNDFPIYLDEFGSGFDTQHRLNISRIIADLVNDDFFSNIFMISHYNESFGCLTNSDIVVLHDANLSIPPDAIVNKNVLIETF